MRTTRFEFYSAILQGGRLNAPSIKESRRDLDRAFRAANVAGLFAG
jgi:hypothetical protein